MVDSTPIAARQQSRIIPGSLTPPLAPLATPVLKAILQAYRRGTGERNHARTPYGLPHGSGVVSLPCPLPY